jgi:AraC-like DNA-binding protein
MTPERIRYLTTSELDDGWQLSCVDVGHALVAPGAPYPPSPSLHPPGYAETLMQGRVLSEYQLLFIAQGGGRLRVRSSEYALEAGTAFLLFPGVPHSYAPDPETGWSEYWAGFRGPYPDLLTKRGFFSPGEPVYPHGLPPSAVGEFRQLIDDVGAEAPGYRLLAASRILVLLSHLEASRRAQNQADGTAALAAQARLFLEDHADRHDVDLAELARRLGLSYASFSTLFHQYTGLSPHQYWLNLKINRAKGLLEEGRSVKETAFALGFESEFYFSRLFKKKTGAPPSKWNRL